MDRPDIVLVMTDQQRFDQVGYASGGHFETPVLDALARRGVIFENAYSAAPVCVPARNALLTGIQPHRLPTQHNDMALQEGTWTVAHALRHAGYDTALIGKMHFTPMHADHGFDHMRTSEHLSASRHGLRKDGSPDLDDYHSWLVAEGHASWEPLEVGQPPKVRQRQPSSGEHGAPFPYDLALHPTSWIEREVDALLASRRSSRPLFLVISFPHPHEPLNPLGSYASLFDVDDARIPTVKPGINDELPTAFRHALLNGQAGFRGWRVEEHGEAALRSRLCKARAVIRHIDDVMGRLLVRFDSEETFFVFTADHGDFGGHRGLAAKSPWIPFDDLIRVPLVFAGPGLVGGRCLPSLVQSSDIALTLCDVAGVEVAAEEYDSRSLRPLLEDRAEAADCERSAAFATTSGWPGVRKGRWKLVLHPPEWSGALFDLEDDPDESVNRIDDPACAQELEELKDIVRQTFRRSAPELERFELQT